MAYKYRGTYDSGELGRINDLVDKQRQNFLDEEKKQSPIEDKVKKYFFVFMGLGAIVLITKLATKWKK